MQITPPLPLGTALSSRGGGRSHHRASAMGRVRRRRSLRRQSRWAQISWTSRACSTPTSIPSSRVHAPDAGASPFEAPNRVLVRRVLDSTTGNVQAQLHAGRRRVRQQLPGELLARHRPPAPATSTSATRDGLRRSHDQRNPEQVRSVIIELGIRSPVEDPAIDTPRSPTRGRASR